MRAQEKRTVRFDELVKCCGRPEPVTLWTAPEDDREFMRAMKENRVATLIQPNVGTKKDYGLVGFFQQSNAAYIVFPEPLPYSAETRIVGIKYERLAEPPLKGAAYVPRRGGGGKRSKSTGRSQNKKRSL